MTNYLPREIAPRLERVLQLLPVVMLSVMTCAGTLCETYVLAYNDEESVQLGEKLWAIPIGKLIE